MALLLGCAVEQRGAERARRPYSWLAFALSLVGLGWIFRAGTPPAFADRRDAVEIGARARELGAPALLIDSPDYSYLAVTAAFGRPNAAVAFDDRDPRHARASDPFVSASALAARAAERQDAWLVVTPEHLPLAARLGTVRANNASFALVATRGRALVTEP
jgi:hypothetical protein